MKLSYKLFLSYVFVVLVALLVLAIATAFVAPANFAQQMTHMQGNGAGMMGQHIVELEAELQVGFQDAVNNALILAGIAAILTAMGVSWFVSQRIINPIRSLVVLSQRIANGHYEQRLQLDTRDELGELVDSFNRMTQSLANTEAMRVQLLGDVSHELKTPLASIKGYMEALQDGVLPVTPETFQLIHQEADRLQRLVDDLQQLSRTEAGQVSMNIQTHKPDEIVQAVIERMRPQFHEKGIQLHVDVPQTLPEVRADRDRTAQVLTNLIGNALQYTASGGEVRVTALSEHGFVRFSVTDTGCGLAATDLDRVFQRFYRVDKSRSRASGGSGIGLTLAKHLIEAQGGDISVTSAGLGKGSQFTFTLPTV
ncbi:HAMP domain-containing histidine kinase [Phototrophicus methaneseepsis]|uniref:histidine kinase n=1 Tax=Phototrophicus methaneseepsis TaxID=2710758 RepID=A0A7S8IE06_9CHLR|nr:ATP-binding protein [Phototrophicus methaneseepsis]QPC83160.1 HAMP domain-containing histidine kinase [Phototrophicus methaneseepsis]